MSKKLLIAAASLYLAGCAVTFGHSAAAGERQESADYQQCLSRNEKFCWRDDADPALRAVLAAMTWPLYWSWEFWR